MTLSRLDFGLRRHQRLRRSFENAYVAAAKAVPPHALWLAGMFERRPAPDIREYYFTPDAVAFFAPTLEAFLAVDCAPPPRAGTILLVASDRCWGVLRAA